MPDTTLTTDGRSTPEPPAARSDEIGLRRLMLRYEAILANAPLGIAFTRSQRFEHANARFEQLLGWPVGTLAGQPTSAAWGASADPASIAYRIGPLLARGRPIDLDTTITRRDGGELAARLRVMPIDGAGADASDAIWIVEDVTEHRRSVEALRAARDELEQRVRERTDELARTNAQLLAEVAEREAAEQRVRHLAQHDVLTGVANRRLLGERMDLALATARRRARRCALMFIDLDRFKIINDTHGHTVGDALLKSFAARAGESLRAGDTVARVGGDEFVVLLAEVADRDEAQATAQRLLERLSQPYPLASVPLTVTPSIGIAIFPDDADDGRTLFACADSAMYDAKAAGRACIRFFDRHRR